MNSSEKGEITTILTIATVLFLAVSTIISTVFLTKGNQSTSTFARGLRCPGPNCDQCGKNGFCDAGCPGYPSCGGVNTSNCTCPAAGQAGYCDPTQHRWCGNDCQFHDELNVPNGCQAAAPTSAPSVGTCTSNTDKWFCAGECANQDVRATFNSVYPPDGSSQWKQQKAQNCGIDPSQCSTAQCGGSPGQPICKAGNGNTYQQGTNYCDGNKQMFCQNVNGAGTPQLVKDCGSAGCNSNSQSCNTIGGNIVSPSPIISSNPSGSCNTGSCYGGTSASDCPKGQNFTGQKCGATQGQGVCCTSTSSSNTQCTSPNGTKYSSTICETNVSQGISYTYTYSCSNGLPQYKSTCQNGCNSDKSDCATTTSGSQNPSPTPTPVTSTSAETNFNRCPDGQGGTTCSFGCGAGYTQVDRSCINFWDKCCVPTDTSDKLLLSPVSKQANITIWISYYLGSNPIDQAAKLNDLRTLQLCDYFGSSNFGTSDIRNCVSIPEGNMTQNGAYERIKVDGVKQYQKQMLCQIRLGVPSYCQAVN